MSAIPTLSSQMFEVSVLELPDQFELVLEAKFNGLESILSKVARAERITHLMQLSASSAAKYNDINEAFLYGILAKDQKSSHEVHTHRNAISSNMQYPGFVELSALALYCPGSMGSSVHPAQIFHFYTLLGAKVNGPRKTLLDG
jgi:hypothetical protein